MGTLLRCVGTLALTSLCGCPLTAAEPQPNCQQAPPSEPVQLGEHSLAVTCISFGSIGLPTGPMANPDYRHLVEIWLEGGATLGLYFDNGFSQPHTLDLSEMETPEGRQYGLRLTDNQGFEGATRDLCDMPAGFPSSAAVAGEMVLDQWSVGADGFLTEFHGSVEAELEGCTVSTPAITNQNITVRAHL